MAPEKYQRARPRGIEVAPIQAKFLGWAMKELPLNASPVGPDDAVQAGQAVDLTRDEGSGTATRLRAPFVKKLYGSARTLSVRLTIGIALIAFVGTTACATDSTTAPPNTRSTNAAARRSTVLDQAITVVALQRTTPLETAQSVSAHIGVLGGQLSLPDAGLTVVVPPFAVVTPVTMTVTAPAGSNVAYEFSPHGLSFLAPLVATQSLAVTEARAGGLIDPLSLFVGYYPDSSHVTTVTELLDLQIDLTAQSSTALLWHFSGYMWSSGRDDSGDTLSTTMNIRPAPKRVVR
jgi:hypothetical protein